VLITIKLSRYCTAFSLKSRSLSTKLEKKQTIELAQLCRAIPINLAEFEVKHLKKEEK
jgi:hypothetical protein